MLAATITERHDAAEITAPRFLVSLDLSDPFADAVALSFGESRRDGQEQLREPIAGNIAAEIEQVQTDATFAQVFHHLQRVERRAEQPVELRRDNDIALSELCEQGTAFRPLMDRDGPGHAFFDRHTSEREPVHVGIPLNLAALHVEALALARLSGG